MFHAPLDMRARIKTNMAKVQAHSETKAGAPGDSTPPVKPKSARFIVGIGLMSSSFLVYPAYPVIILWLPLSGGVKASASVAVWLLSWGTFSLGAYFAGPDGYAWFKGLWQRLIGNGNRT